MSNALAQFLMNQSQNTPGPIMSGFRLPVDNSYSSVMGGMPAMPMSDYTGQADYMGSLAPSLAGVNMTNLPVAQGGGGWGTGIRDALSGSGFLGSTDANGMRTDGWGGMAINAASGLMNGFMAMKQYGLAKKSFEQGKKEFDLNFGAQRKMVNSQLEDRQRARTASNPGAYQSVSDYMKKNGI